MKTTLAVLVAATCITAHAAEADVLWGCRALICVIEPSVDCAAVLGRLKAALDANAELTCPGVDVQAEATRFDPCPLGTAQADGAGFVRLTAPVALPEIAGYTAADAGRVYRDNSGGSGDANPIDPALRVCVAGGPRKAESENGITVTAFDRIYVQEPQMTKPYLVRLRRLDGSVMSVRRALP